MKKQNPVKALQLSRETLQTLENDRLPVVHGGAGSIPTNVPTLCYVCHQ
jgi:hypothetical protein